MQINIKRIDPTLPLPKYQTEGSAAFDLYCREDMTVEPKSIGRLPTNLIVETPPGYALVVTLRSSSPKRKNFNHPGGIGVVDSDYRGPDDEILVQVYNFSDKPVQVEKGERIAQAFFVQIPRIEFTENGLSSEDSRGGFGSTGS